ncbi:hypothetical protein [Priestia endophytica]|uniref:hypothetical protein n=1 Tax=Priestia endophytica TaxID=135735 RepID=UPI00227DB986|nr:hypothetical protein [Priestia endophytica]MCY8235085.1 hypothetical protein [Priestia endophytica]
MPNIDGHIISGEFDEENNIFSLQRVKHFFTESTLNENQLNILYNYLKNHENENDGQIITLYDQMPVYLSQNDIKVLLCDLEQIQSLYPRRLF